MIDMLSSSLPPSARKMQVCSLALVAVFFLAFTPSFSPLAHAQEAPPPPPLDHFKCYRASNPNPLLRVLVLLEDQFDVGLERFDTTRIVKVKFFCNPTTKQHGNNAFVQIQNPDHHLTLYVFKQFFAEKYPPKFEVIVDNQFGIHTMIVQKPQYLMVPSKKTKIQGAPTTHGDPTGLDHYKCYSVLEHDFNLGAVVTLGLQDEFDTRQMNAVMTTPFLFCNPTRKDHIFALGQHQVTDIRNQRDHLTCYNLTQDKVKNGVKNVEVENQFGSAQPLGIGKVEMLCVPSLKMSWGLLPPDDNNSTSEDD
jgi:hypothetical protein